MPKTWEGLKANHLRIMIPMPMITALIEEAETCDYLISPVPPLPDHLLINPTAEAYNSQIL
jgi:hypothetical protein